MEKGNREVHYYLKTNGENLDLAVIGKEKRSRHMSYRYSIRNPNLTPPFKLKSRREVIDWLDSVISGLSILILYKSSLLWILRHSLI